MSNKTMIKSIVVLAVICLVISGALAVVNSFTAPIITAAAIERENASRQQVLPAAADLPANREAAAPPDPLWSGPPVGRARRVDPPAGLRVG